MNCRLHPPIRRTLGPVSPRPVPVLAPRELATALDTTRTAIDAGGALSVADLADACGYSRHHFSRAFTATLGISPARYVAALRMDRAKRLLLAESDPVIDIAVAVGFDSLSSFTRRFHDTVGVPPARLRQLADKLGDTTPTPFRLGADSAVGVRIALDIPAQLRPPGELAVWVGWYPHPAPVGMPAAGIYSHGDSPVHLPLSAGNPWLLAFATTATAEPHDQLVPTRPLVAAHPAPVLFPGALTLHFFHADARGVPLLSALPALRERH